MIGSIKSRIRNYINREITSGVAHQNSNQQQWDNKVTLNMPHKAFNNLLSVSNYQDGNTNIKPENLKLEKNINEYVENDNLPLPSTEDREGYMGDRHYEFWLGGLDDYLKMKNILKKHGYNLDPGFSIFDMGCASGRVLRHFHCQESDLNLWASDINSNHVCWVMKYLGTNIKVFQNHALPHLPIEDNSLDLLYAFSVFSHIDTFELAWLLEVRRILKPNGLAYLTIHSDNTWSTIKEGNPLYEGLLHHPDFSPDLLQSKLPEERTVFRQHGHTSYASNVFYSVEYIKKIWGRYFEVLEIIPGGHNYQDVVLLRKKD